MRQFLSYFDGLLKELSSVKLFMEDLIRPFKVNFEIPKNKFVLIGPFNQ